MKFICFLFVSFTFNTRGITTFVDNFPIYNVKVLSLVCSYTIVRSLRSKMGLCYCPGTTTITMTPTQICKFAHYRRPFLLYCLFLFFRIVIFNNFDISLKYIFIFKLLLYCHIHFKIFKGETKPFK